MTDTANTIRITDLAEPVLTPELLAKFEMVKNIKLELTIDSLIATARERTGFENFNGESFIPHYEVLMKAYREEADLNPMGRLTVFEICVGYLSNRLKLEELYRRHPEIEDVELEAPIIITGLPRTGTTHLHNLIYADGRFRGLHFYEASCPVPDSIDVMPATREEDPRYQRCSEMVEGTRVDMPLFSAMHEISPDYLHEEIDLLAMEGLTAEFEVLARVPSYRDYMRRVDNTDAYRYVKRALKALSWLQGPNRWVLKSPQHNGCLPAMKTVFPDATVAFTHRDPLDVVASMTTMIAYTHRVGYNRVDTRIEGEYWSEHCQYYLKKLVEDRNVWPESQSVDVYFTEFMKDNLTPIQQIFDKARLQMDGIYRSNLQRYIDDNPRSKHGKVLYDLEGDFGVNRQELKRSLQFYMDRFNIPWEQ